MHPRCLLLAALLGGIAGSAGAFELPRAERISVFAEAWCRGPREHWYRGAKKLNLTALLQRTRDVLAAATAATSKSSRP